MNIHLLREAFIAIENEGDAHYPAEILERIERALTWIAAHPPEVLVRAIREDLEDTKLGKLVNAKEERGEEEMRQEDKERLILDLLAVRPMTGLQLIHSSNSVLKRGTIYVLLSEMQRRGLVERQGDTYSMRLNSVVDAAEPEQTIAQLGPFELRGRNRRADDPLRKDLETHAENVRALGRAIMATAFGRFVTRIVDRLDRMLGGSQN